MKFRLNAVGGALLGLGLATTCIAAHAQEHESIGPPPTGTPGARAGGTMQPTGLFLMPGANLSLAFDRAKDIELSLGAEVSLVTLREDLLWAGTYLDATYGTRSNETRLSIGPELGFGFIGLDAGYLLKLGGDHGAQHGISLRPMLTAGVVTAYFRSAWLLGANSDWSGEIGALVKLPVELGH